MKKLIIKLDKGKIIIHRKDSNQVSSIIFEDTLSSNIYVQKINQNLAMIFDNTRINPIFLTDLELEQKLKEIFEKELIEETIEEKIIEKTKIFLE